MCKNIILISIILSSFLFSQDDIYTRFGIDTANKIVPKGLSVGEIAPEFNGFDQTCQSNYGF